MTVERRDVGTPPPPSRPTPLPASVRRRGSATRPRSGARWSPGCATTSARTGSARSCSGMSGGIDSAVVAAIAADAIGGDERLRRLACRATYSSEHSQSDAADLAERIGAHYRVVPIAPMVDAFVASLELTGLAEENVQARVRGTTLMALSNAEGHLVLATGNKSELAVGYSTIYGDAVGGFAPIKDVPKTLVWRLARWRNAHAEARGEPPPIPQNSISKPPSAELRPGPARHRLAARLRGARRGARALRRRRPGRRRDRRPTGSTPTLVERVAADGRRAPSGSAGSTRPARRSASRPSAGTAGCPSPTAGARRIEPRLSCGHSTGCAARRQSRLRDITADVAHH